MRSMNTKIAMLRRKAGFSSQEQLAKHLDIPRSTIAKFEAGITTPRIATLSKMAVALQCSIEDLIHTDPVAEALINSQHPHKANR